MRSARARTGEGRGGSWRTRSPARSTRRSPCHATATMRVGRDDVRPLVVHLAGHRHHRPAGRGHPVRGQGRDRQRHPGLDARLDAARGRLDVVVDRALGQRDAKEVHAGVARAVSSDASAACASTPTTAAVRSPSRAVASAAYVTPPPIRHPRGSSGAMSRQAEPTCTTSTPGESSHLPRAGLRAVRRILPHPNQQRRGPAVFFYELHEGDDEVYSDVSSSASRSGNPRSSSTSSSESATTSRNTTRGHADRGDRQRAGARPRVRLRQRRTARRPRSTSREETDNFLADLETDEDDEDDDDEEEDARS